MKHLILGCLLCIASWGWGHYPPLPDPRSEAEALLIRRIMDLWQDKEYAFAKTHIATYLKENPVTPFSDHFWAMLGDIALQHQEFEEALHHYSLVKGEELQSHVQIKKWETLYHMGKYAELYQETAPFMTKQAAMSEELRFYFAEGAFREAMTLARFPEGQEMARSLCQEALPCYESLSHSALFSSHAQLAMAEIYRLLDSPEEAARLYLSLAEHEKNEDVLFHAASVLTQCDKPKAEQIFKKMARAGGARAADAAYQWLLLLAEGEEWQTIAHERELFVSRLGEAKEAIGYFYLGMISYEKGLFHQAIADLQKCTGKGLPPQHEKRALMTLLASSSALEQWELCEMSFETLCNQFPQTKPEASLMLATAYHKGNNKTRAFKLYERITQDFPDSPFAELAAVEKVRLLMERKQFGDAHALLLTCLERYPQSVRRAEMIRLAINLSLTQLAEEEVYAQLATDLERGLQARLFYKEEKREKELLLAKVYLKLNRVNGALQLLLEHNDPDPLLMTHCYIKEGTCPEKVVECGEKALLTTQGSEAEGLHLHLFNAYVEMAKEHNEAHYTRKAADHLSAVIDTYPVSLENRLWLIHYYAKEEALKAIPLLESLVQSEANLQRFDTEATLLASLYQEHDHFEKAEPLLEKIITLQQKTAPEAKLKLATLYALQGKRESAYALYQKLEGSAQLEIAFAARLHLARLDFAENPEKSLKKLHDLSQRKSLAYEPVHLEAALDYAELKASTYPAQERPTRLLELLSQVKEEFTKRDDVWSKDYHASREFFPDKDLVYQAYMRYLDARIYALQAKLAQDTSEGKTKQNAARALFSTLRQGKYAVSPYIKERATAGLYE